MSKEEDKTSSAFHMFLETSLKDQWHPSLSYLLWLLACCCDCVWKMGLNVTSRDGMTKSGISQSYQCRLCKRRLLLVK